MHNTESNEARRINLAWAILIAATLASWWLAEDPGAHRLGRMAAGIVLALSAVKGLVIALDFMELGHAPKLWRRALLAWLCVILAVIFATRFFS